LNRAIRIDEAQIRSHLDMMVRDSVEDTLNKLLDEEADRPVGGSVWAPFVLLSPTFTT
jgi:hypothetical protein